MIPSWLSPVVDRLASDLRNRSIREAVRSWARELAVDVGAIDEAETLIVDLAYRLYTGARGTHIRNQLVDKTPLVATLSEADFKKGLKRMDTRDVVLIALSVTAAGFVIHRLTRERPQPERRPAPCLSPSTPARRVLILVVNAARSDILTRLRTEGRLDPTLAEALYKATQALWIGSEAEFECAPIRTWLDPARRVARDSEYDVHLVKILLADEDSGFGPGATQIDRIDAFARLAMSRAAIEVSERVPSEAYGTTGAHSR